MQDLDPATRKQFQVPATIHSVLVSGVSPDGSAGATGLPRGDVITELDRRPAPTVEVFQQAAKSAAQSAIECHRNQRSDPSGIRPRRDADDRHAHGRPIAAWAGAAPAAICFSWLRSRRSAYSFRFARLLRFPTI